MKFFAVLCLLPLWLHGLVYDCFPFFNELELLQVRFAELDETVDYFVLVESVETQRGDLKPLFFEQNKALFAKYLPKVIHIVVNERHPEMGLWKREHYQRNAIMRGLKKRARSSDVVIISDLDEIPRSTVIAKLVKDMNSSSPIAVKKPVFKSEKQKKKYQKKYASMPAYALEMNNYYYQLNRQTATRETWDGGMWYGTVVTTYAELKKHSPQYFRNKRNKISRIERGGWHFSWMGGRDKIRQKLVSVVEGRVDGAQVTDREIDEWIARHPAVPLDDSFPKYILERQDYFRSIDFLAP